jgi:pyrroline-5-carboxylate reductase
VSGAMVKLALVGGGRMGEALLGGLLDAGWAKADELAVVEKLAGRRDELTALHPGVAVVEEAIEAEGVVLAVKPGDVPAAAAACRAAGTQRALSIAAGVTLGTLGEALGPVPVVRAMPNTPALVGAAASAIAGGPTASADDVDWAESILASVGTVVRVPESLMDAVTGLSGSGPAYVFLVAEALVEAGVRVGLPRDVATELAVGTIVGAGRLLAESGEDAAALRAAVTSPGGTTAAGLHALESAAVRAAFLDAVVAATDRSRELGGS